MPDGASNDAIGVKFHPRSDKILPQAVAGVIMQSLYEAYYAFGSQPNSIRSAYYHEEVAAKPTYDVQILFQSNNLTDSAFEFTNLRMAQVLSLLGFDYSLQKDLTFLYEYDFSVVIEPNVGVEQVIATGSLVNRNRGKNTTGDPASTR